MNIKNYLVIINLFYQNIYFIYVNLFNWIIFIKNYIFTDLVF